MRLSYTHAQTAAVMRCVTTHGGRDLTHDYGESGADLGFLVPRSRVEALTRCLQDATRGEVHPRQEAEAVLRT
jgi:hypothetical protein